MRLSWTKISGTVATQRGTRCGARALLLVLPAALTGCMHLDTHIRVQADGGATITEKLRFSRRLLDLSGKDGSDLDLLSLLGKAAAEQRVKQMGQGANLVSHDLKEVEGGAKESIAVYKIADLNELHYVSPWLAYVDYPANNVVRCKFEPVYKSRPYQGAKAGEMTLSFYHLKPPKGDPPLPKDAPPPAPPAPRELQVFREIQPMFRDMLKNFKLKLTVEAYCPIARCGLGLRNPGSAPKSVDLINFSDKNLDKLGGGFLENEEVMLDLVRGELGSVDIVEHIKNFAQNETLPVFLPFGSRNMWWLGSGDIPFKPSRALFDKYFTGKKLDYSEWQASPPEKHVTAEFEAIGAKLEGDK